METVGHLVDEGLRRQPVRTRHVPGALPCSDETEEMRHDRQSISGGHPPSLPPSSPYLKVLCIAERRVLMKVLICLQRSDDSCFSLGEALVGALDRSAECSIAPSSAST